jgi:hypothetical protein
METMNGVNIVNMNCVGIISSATGGNNIATYGCSTCVAAAIVNSKTGVVLLGHFSTSDIANLLIQTVYFYEEAVDNAGGGGTNEMYLVGGYEGSSEEIRDSITNLIRNRPDLKIKLVSDESCKKTYEIKSLMVGTDGSVSDYKMTGKEVYSKFDQNDGILCAFSPCLTLSFRPEWGIPQKYKSSFRTLNHPQQLPTTVDKISQNHSVLQTIPSWLPLLKAKIDELERFNLL